MSLTLAIPHSWLTTILTGATATGAGSTYACAMTPGNQAPSMGIAWTVIETIAGGGSAPSAWTINLEGSEDGTNWTILDQNTTVQTEATRFVVNSPVKFLRANITTLTGGSNFTVAVQVVTA